MNITKAIHPIKHLNTQNSLFGKTFSNQNFEIIFLIFPNKKALIFHAIGQTLFSGKNKETIRKLIVYQYLNLIL